MPLISSTSFWEGVDGVAGFEVVVLGEAVVSMVEA